MGITAEFAKLGARLVNNQWAVSALTATEMVASLWFHRLKTENGQLVYRDYLGRWSGHGNRLFAEHLRVAMSDQRPVRLVIAKTDDVNLIESGGDGSKAKKTFKARPEWVGRVTDFDGDRFTIAFNRVGC
ncbi:hypothetical protein [Stenotrophomonas maltophilia]|uniref:hypothetical protein n=1 Tax=Stenotrophomonas maltophilia TaxID=40324 RepID=UPI00066C46F6|nr:hypothetical protein [Stenotrophomonas maltophilia]